jgi:acyl-CoA reductase-like NAD-dependent aldehyde dehydrogenase
MTTVDDRPDTTLRRPDVSPGRLFIGGQWREPAEGGRINVVDPSTGTVVTSVARASTADVNDAVDAARAAFDGWAATPGRHRARILHRVADVVRARADELVAVESLDVGKVATDANESTSRGFAISCGSTTSPAGR